MLNCALCHQTVQWYEKMDHPCGRHSFHHKCFQQRLQPSLQTEMLRCPICQPTSTYDSASAADWSFPFSSPPAASNERFKNATHHAPGYSEPARKKHVFGRFSSDSSFYTPPTSPSNACNSTSRANASNSGGGGDGGTFPFSTPNATVPGPVTNSTLRNLQEGMQYLAIENNRLNAMVLQQMKEKVDLVSRHEEQCFRMVDDFEREKEKMIMSRKENKNQRSTRNKSVAKPPQSNKSDTKPPKSIPSLGLACIGGPHSGETFLLTDTLFVGNKAIQKVTRNDISLWRDPLVSTTHAKLVLKKSGSKKTPVLMVKVYALKSETQVNCKMLPNGSYRQAFAKDRIQVGKSVFLITKMK